MPYTMLAVSHSPFGRGGSGACGSIKSFANRLRYIFAFFIQSPSASAAFVSYSTSMEMDSDVVDDEQHDDEDDEQDDDDVADDDVLADDVWLFLLRLFAALNY